MVLQSRGDQMCKFDEARMMAAAIPGARLVALHSDNHIVLAHEPAWATFMAEITPFLRPEVPGSTGQLPPAPTEPLTERELDVLHLAARGLDNAEIANRLTLSVRTVERHLSNIYLKLGVTGKVARAAAVAYLYRDQMVGSG